jgi:hypothetical protein
LLSKKARRSSAGPNMRRFAAALLMLLAVLFGGARAGAETGALPHADGEESAAPLPSARIRTGVTELADPAAEVTEPPPVVDPEAEVAGPGDAPRVHSTLEVPAVPKGFATFDKGWIVFTYHPSMKERVRPLIAQADSVRRELAERLGEDVLRRVRVDIARTPGEMEGLAPKGAPYPSYAAGVAYSEIGLVLLTLAPRYPGAEHDVEEIFRHELAHVALHDAVLGKPVPRWFNEGFAVLASGETSTKRLFTLWRATLADTLLPLHDVERRFPNDEASAEVAYAEAVDLVRFLIRDREQHRFRALIARLRDGNTLDASLRDSYGIDLVTLEREWREDVAKRYTFWPVLFSGTAVWALILGLAVFTWRKRRRRARTTLARWEKEEALEDARRRQDSAAPRIHIVLTRTAAPAASTPLPSAQEAPDVPKVQHEGQWHTLH